MKPAAGSTAPKHFQDLPNPQEAVSYRSRLGFASRPPGAASPMTATGPVTVTRFEPNSSSSSSESDMAHR